MPRDNVNIGVVHGAWGEDVACERLRYEGYLIVARNVRPVRRDRRLEIDIVAFDREHSTLVFVEVKQHSSRSVYQCRLRSVDRHKRQLLLKACKAYLRANRWQGSYRFDVIEVYGVPERPRCVEIDHIREVRMFVAADRFVDWN